MKPTDLINALRDCFDPHLKCNLADLGMIEKATLTEDLEAPGSGIAGVPQRYHAHIVLLPSSTDELYQAQLAALIQNRLAGLEAISKSTVAFHQKDIWRPERITAEGRRLLGLDRPRPGQLVEIKLP